MGPPGWMTTSSCCCPTTWSWPISLFATWPYMQLGARPCCTGWGTFCTAATHCTCIQQRRDSGTQTRAGPLNWLLEVVEDGGEGADVEVWLAGEHCVPGHIPKGTSHSWPVGALPQPHGPVGLLLTRLVGRTAKRSEEPMKSSGWHCTLSPARSVSTGSRELPRRCVGKSTWL